MRKAGEANIVWEGGHRWSSRNVKNRGSGIVMESTGGKTGRRGSGRRGSGRGAETRLGKEDRVENGGGKLGERTRMRR